MVCPKCNNQIDDIAAFCPACGQPVNAQASAAPVQQPAQAPVQQFAPAGQPVQAAYGQPMQIPYGQPVQAPYGQGMQPVIPPMPAKKKNKAPMIIGIILAVLVGLGIIGNIVSNLPVHETVDDIEIADEFAAAFEEKGLEYTPTIFDGYKSYAYAKSDVDLDNDFHLFEFGVKDDMIVEMKEKYYIPLDFIEEQTAITDFDEMKEIFEEDYKGLDSLSFVSVEYAEENGYFVIIINYHSLDTADNVELLSNYIEMDEGSEFISMEKTADSTFKDYIKR